MHWFAHEWRRAATVSAVICTEYGVLVLITSRLDRTRWDHTISGLSAQCGRLSTSKDNEVLFWNHWLDCL